MKKHKRKNDTRLLDGSVMDKKEQKVDKCADVLNLCEYFCRAVRFFYRRRFYNNFDI